MQMLKNMHMAGIKADVVAYTTAIKVCVESKNLKLAFSLFSEMKCYRIQPNLVTYNTLLRARSKYSSFFEVQQCLAVYRDMRKAGYKPNDYYLKELIEEWCEEVIQGNSQKLSPCDKTDLRRPQSMLLEKVAAHLQKSIAESLAIDLQGLSKVEARIVVLAALQMIKENYTLGHPIKDDMLIILGFRNVDLNPLEHECELKDTIIKLLRDELGLEVDTTGPTLGSTLVSDQNLEEKRGGKLEFRTKTRRPAVLHRLKVPKKSLHQWLLRRVGTIRR